MSTRSRRKSKSSKEEEEEEETQELSQFEPHESDNSQTLWDVISILRESKTKYQVEWAGIDPETGKPWKPTWVPKEDATDVLIQDWKAKKRERKAAKLAAQLKLRPPQSVASSKASTHRSSRTASGGGSVDTIMLGKSPIPTRGFRPFVEITRKRRRSPFDAEEVPPPTTSSVLESEPETQEVDRPQKKRRILDSSSEDTPEPPEFQQYDMSPPVQDEPVRNSPISRPQNKFPTPTNHSRESQNASPQVANGRSPEKPTGSNHSRSPERQKSPLPPSNLRPVPQLSPAVFRERMEVPLSQIEQFSTPGSSPQKPEKVPAEASDVREEAQPEPAMVNAYELIVAPSRVHQLKPKQRDSTWSSPRASSSPSSSNNKLNPMDALPFRKGSAASADRSMEKRISDLEARVERKDVVIESQQTMLASMHRDQAQLAQSLENERRNHDLSKKDLLAQIAVLQERLIRHDTSPSNSAALKPLIPSSMDVTMASSEEPTRSAEDEALIAQLREDNAKLRDANAELQSTSVRLSAEVAHSIAMTEQARDVARRAEVARMELARKEKIAREVAQNAPKLAEELFRNTITMLETELHKHKCQNTLLLQQNRLTGDQIRRKAAAYDVLSPKYKKLSAKHEEMYNDLVQAEDEKETALRYMQRLQEIVLQVRQGPADFATLLQLLDELNVDGETQEQQSGDDEDADADADGDEDEDQMQADHHDAEDEDSVMVTEPDQMDSQPIVEERAPSSSYEGPNLGDPPTIFIEEIDERPLNEAFATPRSTQSERSESLVFACLWHPTDDETCQEHRSTRKSLREHIFKDHLGHL